MKQQKSFKQMDQGKLYLVPTPIGNLEDMTFRSIKMLKEADLIASEDTRNTQKLLNHFEIETKQISLHEHNVKERVPELINYLLEGKAIAQVSDAGMPSISDPGHELVLKAIENDIDVISLPGASAGITALIATGITPQPFLFYGFLPRKTNEQKQSLKKIKELESALIFYESPHRIVKTLKIMSEVFGGSRKVVLCRELTKLFEEYTRGTIEELISFFEDTPIKGECCLIVEGFDGKVVLNEIEESLAIREHVLQVIEQNKVTSKVAIKEVAKIRGLKKQDVYKEYHLE
ncbi:16S rRNA (cytidine(1402)-2'-O)-methyltransferase [Vagococcus carniphilus]|uniref:Ribosomal RNA small subunit methyltransferase I n=1 Tax=Vagococcus carniphilus TaxID=218144 RepID=A0AAW8U4B0_9ENTE|nr:16S rRNA (cytidine(1402)-2'-O)-methyltransferase [Vagococcus carniphilus]MDT2830852.1 16S rRNA (cytidine(1402)-2'-O)-methyltransferase [Vagococcus carniphilus]MDT2834455.1 16S rRNA (cytidine(1402)-2'-O)-methyltransferase [Vagococcus carniphilus]MDT2839376.1 16S rRNA (cytidine(1402)-2'-O)-methyltransferase [Vagococcus carniphilus]MDT2854015.1 16S rRNA (cytidine(1402)-2'-O)-methyltransferase [Vagococcus carniphilus]